MKSSLKDIIWGCINKKSRYKMWELLGPLVRLQLEFSAPHFMENMKRPGWLIKWLEGKHV